MEVVQKPVPGSRKTKASQRARWSTTLHKGVVHMHGTTQITLFLETLSRASSPKDMSHYYSQVGIDSSVKNSFICIMVVWALHDVCTVVERLSCQPRACRTVRHIPKVSCVLFMRYMSWHWEINHLPWKNCHLAQAEKNTNASKHFAFLEIVIRMMR